MTLKIIFWDVQHGSATYIKTPAGKHIVQDLGSGSYKNGIFSPLLYLKNRYNVPQLDQIIITHPHKDHIDDVLNFDELKPRILMRPTHLKREDIMKGVNHSDEKIFNKYFEINDRFRYPVDPSNDPNQPINNGGVKIETFVPLQCSTSNINNHSIVTVLSYAGQKIILPGDNEPTSFKELLEKDEFINAIKGASILLAPHHGRDSSFCPEIFEYFKPKITIVSDGSYIDTSATSKYSSISEGLLVHHRSNGKTERRYCVTTRNDGVIVVEIRRDETNSPIRVTVD